MTHPAITAHKKYYERVKNHCRAMIELISPFQKDYGNERLVNTLSQIIAILSSLCLHLKTERQKVEGACEY